MDRSKYYSYSDGNHFEGKEMIKVFEEIAARSMWIEKESASGFGSSLKQTRELRRVLPGVFYKFGVKKLLDLPCGDFNWMKEVDLLRIEYTGADIVQSVIDQNRQYMIPNISFIQLDLVKDDLGEHDMLLCRDCLVHFSYEDIFKSLDNIKGSRITYLMTTTFPEEVYNKDTVTGGWRPLNLGKAPFNFPPPLLLLNEGCTEMDGVFKDKSLGVWRVDELEFKS